MYSCERINLDPYLKSHREKSKWIRYLHIKQKYKNYIDVKLNLPEFVFGNSFLGMIMKAHLTLKEINRTS